LTHQLKLIVAINVILVKPEQQIFVSLVLKIEKEHHLVHVSMVIMKMKELKIVNHVLSNV